MKPSTSRSAQASVVSIASPCRWRTVILVMMPCVKTCAAILGGAGEGSLAHRREDHFHFQPPVKVFDRVALGAELLGLIDRKSVV